MKLSDVPQSASQKAQSPMLSGAEIVCHAMKEEGVEFVFGYPGGAVLVIYDAINNVTSNTFWCVTSKQQSMRQTLTRAPQVVAVSR
jgi:hypothetical protein